VVWIGDNCRRESLRVAPRLDLRRRGVEDTGPPSPGSQHSSPPGTLHGGILCDVADAAMGCATLSVLEEGEMFATVELKINFLKPVWTGRLTAVGSVVKGGRTITLCDCRVTDEGGSLVAYATCTQITLRE